jgi:hypothetical protein
MCKDARVQTFELQVPNTFADSQCLGSGKVNSEDNNEVVASTLSILSARQFFRDRLTVLDKAKTLALLRFARLKRGTS